MNGDQSLQCSRKGTPMKIRTTKTSRTREELSHQNHNAVCQEKLSSLKASLKVHNASEINSRKQEVIVKDDSQNTSVSEKGENDLSNNFVEANDSNSKSVIDGNDSSLRTANDAEDSSLKAVCDGDDSSIKTVCDGDNSSIKTVCDGDNSSLKFFCDLNSDILNEKIFCDGEASQIVVKLESKDEDSSAKFCEGYIAIYEGNDSNVEICINNSNGHITSEGDSSGIKFVRENSALKIVCEDDEGIDSEDKNSNVNNFSGGDASSVNFVSKDDVPSVIIDSKGDFSSKTLVSEKDASVEKYQNEDDTSNIRTESEGDGSTKTDDNRSIALFTQNLLVHGEKKQLPKDYNKKKMFDRLKLTKSLKAGDHNVDSLDDCEYQLEVFERLCRYRSEYELGKVYDDFKTLARRSEELEARHKVLQTQMQNTEKKISSRTEFMQNEIKRLNETIDKTNQSFKIIYGPVKEVYENAEKLLDRFTELSNSKK